MYSKDLKFEPLYVTKNLLGRWIRRRKQCSSLLWQLQRPFFKKKKAENYKPLVQRILLIFRDIGCDMIVKIHFLNSHFDKLLENLGAVAMSRGNVFIKNWRRWKVLSEAVVQKYDGRLLLEHQIRLSLTNTQMPKLQSQIFAYIEFK